MNCKVLFQCYTYYSSLNYSTITVECSNDEICSDIIKNILNKLNIKSVPDYYSLVEIDITKIEREISDLNLTDYDSENENFVSLEDLKKFGVEIDNKKQPFITMRDYFIVNNKLSGNNLRLFFLEKTSILSEIKRCSILREKSENLIDEWLKSIESDNLVNLPTLDEKIIVEKLEERFQKNKIFTFVDNILIFVNPFVYMPLYNPRIFTKYHNHVIGQLPPHIYAIADDAYQKMIHTNRDQCVVICGESGSGKTETARFLIQQLAYISPITKYSINHEFLLSSIHVLEAFGNAKTISNSNSSRFGKLTQLLYSDTGSISGVILKSYLLEKSRIINQSPNEQNFHIFYYLLYGSEEEDLQKLLINSTFNYQYLTNKFQVSNHSIHQQKLQDLKNSMSKCGLTPEYQYNIFVVVAIILLLGNLKIVKNDKNFSIQTDDSLDKVLKLMQIDEKDFIKSLVSRSTVMRNEIITVYLNELQINGHICTLAKTLYSRLFQWMVVKMNTMLHPTAHNINNKSLCINVLDIFGFENFEENYFEQFCINFANENLQYFFNLHTFKVCQDEYKTENIKWDNIKFSDNQSILSLYQGKPHGLISLIEEECMLIVSSDLSMISKFAKSHEKNPFLCVSPLKPLVFTINHYAGIVEYSANGFREKNLEKYSIELIEVLCRSKQSFIRKIINFNSKSSLHWIYIRSCFIILYIFFKIRKYLVNKIQSSINAIHLQNLDSSYFRRSSNENKRCYMSVVTQFNESLNELLQNFDNCNPYFVRCIHSNNSQEPMKFDSKNVLKQLVYTGVIQSIKIRQTGYNYRIAIPAFIEQFLQVLPANHDLSSIKSYLGSMFDENDFQIGTTKIFIRNTVYDYLNSLMRKNFEKNLSLIECWLLSISIILICNSNKKTMDKITSDHFSNESDTNCSSNYVFKRSQVIYMKQKRQETVIDVAEKKCSDDAMLNSKLSPKLSKAKQLISRPVHSNSTVCRPHSSSDIIVRNISELYLFYQFIVEKVKANTTPNNNNLKSLSYVDLKFQQSLKSFSFEILAKFLTSQQSSEKIEWTFDHIFYKFSNYLKKLSIKSNKKHDDSFVVVLNAFSGMLYEFKNNYNSTKNTNRVKLFQDKATFNYKLHSMKSTDVNDHTFCDYCALSITNKAFKCLDCNTIVHKNCLSYIKNQCITSNTTFFSINKKKFFGLSLNCLPCNSFKIPLKLLALLQEIELRGLTAEGIYRKSSNEKTTKKLKNELESNDFVDLRTLPIHCIAAAVKYFFRNLPTPLIPSCHIDLLIKSDDLMIERIDDLLNKLPLFNRRVFDRVVYHLSMVELYSNVNLMDASNLSVIFTPCILHNDVSNISDIERMKKQNILLETCIKNQSSIFRGTINQFIDT